jgi:hypothetical protein
MGGGDTAKGPIANQCQELNMVKTKTAAGRGKTVGKHGGNRGGHHARGADKVGRAARQGAGKDPVRGSKGRR